MVIGEVAHAHVAGFFRLEIFLTAISLDEHKNDSRSRIEWLEL